MFIKKIRIFLEKQKQLLLYKRHYHYGSNLVLEGRVSIKFDVGSRMVLNNRLTLGYNSITKANGETKIRLDENAKIIINGDARIFYGGDVYLFKDAVLTIGNSYINSNCTLRVTNKVIIGNGCAIAWNVSIMDSEFHCIDGKLNASPIIIEDHVWVGANSTILPGVTVGYGAIVAAGAVVKDNVPPKCLVAGIPARIIKENVEWNI